MTIQSIKRRTGNTSCHAGGMKADSLQATEPRKGTLSRLLEVAEKHAQPAHDEEGYYNPPPRQDPWEGIGYFWFALSAGVAGWACSHFLLG